FEQKEPQRFRPYFLLGEAYRKNKQTTEAVENYRKAIGFAPQHLPSYKGILTIAMDSKDQYESRTILAQMIVAFGPKPEFINTQCQLMSEGGFLAEAEKTCRSAISKSRNTPENHIYLAQSLDNQDRKQAAENVYRNAARQFGKSEFVQFATGEYYFYQKNYATAVRYLTKAVKIKSDSARSQLALAQSLYESNDLKKALVHFEQACKLDKTKVAYNEMRAAAAKLFKAGKTDMASEYDKKSAICY
ncbi:MAG: tetratricopeptide repeat protein, partial [Bdellovibrionota bacterium]